MDPYLATLLKEIEEAAREVTYPHLISVQELRAAGALDVPPAWRKSLRSSERQLDLFAGLNDDDPAEDEDENDPDSADEEEEEAEEDEEQSEA